MATPEVIPVKVQRDTVTHLHRITRGNRSLWYQMTVLQQPERARACGSGMKANSDRRPVDPPPVVELRIIEGPSIKEGRDITFDYNANFFLYASLEHARPIAHGRVQTPATSNPPILTGVPASGMAYLDRPMEAGYFIFPDLSVRHEGRYRLTFSLFETTKEEKDFDMEPSEGDLPQGVDWRMEIKTSPFSVFSAKKFPGLMESTQLSKTVADQGCRVRIRRDVRMRKRDRKSGGGDFERREEEFPRRRNETPASENPHAHTQAQAQAQAQAHAHSIRARSQSNSSEQRAAYPEPSRRPSAADSYHHPPQPPPPPPPPGYEAAPPASRHLSFGDPSASHYPTPRQYAQPILTPISTAPYAPANHSPYAKPEGPSYGFPSRNLPPTCPSPAPSIKHDTYDRRQSGHYVPPSPSLYSNDGHIRRESQPSYPATPISAHPSHAPHMPRPLHSQTSLPSLKISSLMSPLPPIEAQLEPSIDHHALVPLGGKRKHDTVFSQSVRPLHNGQRQMDPHYGHNNRQLTPEPGQGLYSRADGKINTVTFNQYEY